MSLAKQLLDKEAIKFRVNLEKERLFGQYPVSLKVLKETALSTLENISSELLSSIAPLVNFDIQDSRLLKKFIKDNPRLAAILKYANGELDDEIVAGLLLKCENANNSGNLEEFDDFSAYSKLSEDVIKSANDLLTKVDKFSSSINELLDENMKYIEAGVMAYYIIRLVIDLFENADFPSYFRLKYLQKIIRYTLASIWNSTKDQYIKIKNWLSSIDNLMLLVVTAGTLYLVNRKKSQEEAIDLMLENACPKIKESYEQAILQAQIDPSTQDFEIELSCPIKDTNFVPKEPYDNKLENFSCPIDSEVDAISAPEIPGSLSPELSIKAKIVNNRESEMTVLVEKEQFVSTSTKVATIQTTPVYSPVEGYIESFTSNQIVISDISDPEEDELMIAIDGLQSAYDELNEIKNVLREYQIDCLYPIMLAKSPVTDGEITDEENEDMVNEKMEKQFDKIKNKWYGSKVTRGLLKNYEKRVEKITSKDNVEEHAENETTIKIKEDLDKEDNKLFKYLLKSDDEGLKMARVTKALNGEYELLEYYVNNIVLRLNENKLEDESQEKRKYLPDLRNQMNNYVRERYVIEKWNKKKISDKAIELLKDLERGATNGSKLWKEGLEKYEERKKLSDVKKWLENDIKPRRKLEVNEVEDLIDRIFFLYEFFLDIEAITEDYKNLEGTDVKKQTEKEGNWLLKFFRDLQFRYRRLPTEIKRLEKRIEDLSLLSEYYNQDIGGISYRIYSINSENDICESTYAKDTNSKYQLNDIRYWIKWCGFATLTGLIPLYWSTGLFAPGPIPFPVVYIPIKPINTKYGVILFGLTVTGLYPFPMVLFANQSSQYASIIPIPGVNLIKKSIEDLKNSISEQLENFTKNVLQEKLDILTEEITELETEINGIKEQLFTLKVNRPPKTRSNISEYMQWLEQKSSIEAEKTTLGVQKWKKEKTHQIINNAKQSGSLGESSDPELLALKTIEKTINDKLDNLVSKIDEIDGKLSPLPTTLDPYSANFGFTLKNPKPTIEIANKLNDNINASILDNIIKPFQLNNEGFMSGPVKFNKSGYDVALKLSRWTMIKNDPYPKYEEIGIINIPFQKFLTTDFLLKGAQTYGIPGQLPAPV